MTETTALERTKKLAFLITQCHQAERLITEARQELANLKASVAEQPQTATIEQAMQYQTRVRYVQANEVRLTGFLKEWNGRLSKLEQDIIAMLPLKNCWIQVNQFAVGYYTDAWGGNHTELSIRLWSDDLPPLRDHTYYP